MSALRMLGEVIVKIVIRHSHYLKHTQLGSLDSVSFCLVWSKLTTLEIN